MTPKCERAPDGICRRCFKKFDNPYPKIDFPEKNTEIATTLCCADCNAEVMSYVHRGASAYTNPRRLKKVAND